MQEVRSPASVADPGLRREPSAGTRFVKRHDAG